MANIQSNIKRHNQDTKKRKLNHSRLSDMRTAIKKSYLAEPTITIDEVYKNVDTAARKGKIHKNKAARLKSKAAKRLAVAA